jgi:hypothetical protein
MSFADNGMPGSRDFSERKSARVAVNAEVSLRRSVQLGYRDPSGRVRRARAALALVGQTGSASPRFAGPKPCGISSEIA